VRWTPKLFQAADAADVTRSGRGGMMNLVTDTRVLADILLPLIRSATRRSGRISSDRTRMRIDVKA